MVQECTNRFRIIVTFGREPVGLPPTGGNDAKHDLALATLVIASTPPALAASTREAPVNKATEIHGAPGNTPGAVLRERQATASNRKHRFGRPPSYSISYAGAPNDLNRPERRRPWQCRSEIM